MLKIIRKIRAKNGGFSLIPLKSGIKLGFAAIMTAAMLFTACGGDDNGGGGNSGGGTYTVTFDKGEGGGSAPASQSVNAGETITLPGQDDMTAPAGKSFGGWNTNSEGTGTNYDAGATYTPTASITLYANWIKGNNLVFIKGGTFTMGSPTSETNSTDNERPQHSVTVSSFYMGKYEVTQKEFADVMGQLPASLQSESTYGKGDNYPVYYVSWYDAIAYCNKLSVRDGLTPAYTVSGISDWASLAYSSIPISDNATWSAANCDFSASGYRLPTEAEWEYACRAGTTTAWSTGNSEDVALKAAAWYSANSSKATHPVGQKAANPWGLYDMHGNVFEWCWDWYDSSYYSSSPSSNPTGASSGSYRVIRGGGWDTSAQYLRSALRGYDYPSYCDDDLGFRLLRSAQ